MPAHGRVTMTSLPSADKHWVSGAWLMLGAWLCAALALSLTHIRDADFWWQLELGRTIVSSRQVPTTELWMHTREGFPTFSLSSGYACVLYEVHQLFGDAGIVALKSLVITGTLLAIARFCVLACGMKAGTIAAQASVAGVLPLVVLASSPRFVARPEIVAMALLVSIALVLDRAWRRPGPVALVCPALIAIFVNVHSLFSLGVVLVGVATLAAVAGPGGVIASRFHLGSSSEKAGVADQRCRTRGAWLVATLALSLLATLASPFTWRVWEVPLRRLTAVLGEYSTFGTVVIVMGVGVGGAAMIAAYVLAPRAGRAWRLFPAAVRRRLTRSAIIAAGIFVVVAGSFILLSVAHTSHGAADVALHAQLAERRLITELAPAWTLPANLVSTWAFVVLVAAWLASVIVAVRRLPFMWVIFGAIGIVMGLLAQRAIMLAAVFAMPTVCCGAAAVWERLLSAPQRGRLINALVLAGALAGVATVALGVSSRFWSWQDNPTKFGFGIDPDANYSAHAAIIRLGAEHSTIPARVFNSELSGSFLMSRGLKVFIDSRAVGGILPEFAAALNDPQELATLVPKYKCTAAVIDLIDSPMLRWFHKRQGWRLVMLDQRAAVFVRAGFAENLPTLKLDEPAAAATWFESVRPSLPAVARLPSVLDAPELPWARTRLARTAASFGASEPALRLLEDAQVLAPWQFRDWALLGTLYRKLGDDERADQALRAGAEKLKDPSAMLLLAARCVEQNDAAKATTWAERAFLIERSRAACELGLAAAEASNNTAAVRVWTDRLNAFGTPSAPPSEYGAGQSR